MASQRVLVVDDEPFFREAIRDALAEAGLACELAASGDLAVKAAADPRVACVVLEVRLRDRSGVDVLRALREQRPGLRVIVLSSHGDQERVLDALRLGASDYLAKPIHEEELRLAVMRALDAYAVESRFESLRGRLHLLADHAAALTAARDESAAEGSRRVAAALAEVMGAERTSVMRLSPDGSRLRVEGSHGHWDAPEEADAALVEESISGLAVREGRALLIDDVDTDPRCRGRARRPDFRERSVALAPLDAGSGCTGVLCATDRLQPGPFPDEDLALLRVFARLAAEILAERAPEPAAAEPPTAAPPDPGLQPHVELVRGICDAMTRETVPERLLAAALRPVARAVGARVVSVLLIENRTGTLVREAQYEGTSSDRAELPRDRGLTGGSLQSGMLVAAPHPERDPRFDPEVDTPEDGEPGPLLVVPLRVRDRTLGVARVFPAPGADADACLAEVLAAPLSAAVRNVLLYRSLLEAVDDVARARREAEAVRGA